MNSTDSKIIQMRKSKAYVISILNVIANDQPNMDELVLLGKILCVLDEHDFGVSKNEVRTAFNKFYSEKYHGGKDSYLSWFYEQFHIKNGVVTNTSNVRHDVSKKTPISQTYRAKEAKSTHKINNSIQTPTFSFINQNSLNLCVENQGNFIVGNRGASC